MPNCSPALRKIPLLAFHCVPLRCEVCHLVIYTYIHLESNWAIMHFVIEHNSFIMCVCVYVNWHTLIQTPKLSTGNVLNCHHCASINSRQAVSYYFLCLHLSRANQNIALARATKCFTRYSFRFYCHFPSTIA